MMSWVAAVEIPIAVEFAVHEPDVKVSTQLAPDVPVIVSPLKEATPDEIVAVDPVVMEHPPLAIDAVTVPVADVTTLPPESSTFTTG